MLSVFISLRRYALVVHIALSTLFLCQGQTHNAEYHYRADIAKRKGLVPSSKGQNDEQQDIEGPSSPCYDYLRLLIKAGINVSTPPSINMNPCQ